MAAQQFANGQRRGKEQLQRAIVSIQGQTLAGDGQDPDLDEEVQEVGKKQGQLQFGPQLTVQPPGPKPNGGHRTEKNPGIKNGLALAAGEPENGIDGGQARPEGAAAGGIA